MLVNLARGHKTGLSTRHGYRALDTAWGNWKEHRAHLPGISNRLAAFVVSMFGTLAMGFRNCLQPFNIHAINLRKDSCICSSNAICKTIQHSLPQHTVNQFVFWCLKLIEGLTYNCSILLIHTCIQQEKICAKPSFIL